MKFDTKVAVVLREDLPTWQKLNVTAFIVSGIAATMPESVGEPYEDACGRKYLPMFIQPVLVFAGNSEQLRDAFNRAVNRNVPLAIYTDELFATNNDTDNRASVKQVRGEDLQLVGIAMREEKKPSIRCCTDWHFIDECYESQITYGHCGRETDQGKKNERSKLSCICAAHAH